ncbi:protein unc-13 homolog 4B-like [Glossina fuscipes fuscipes]
MIRSDLQRATEYFDKHFYHKMRLNFSSVLLKYYDKKLVEIVKSIVSEVCGNIKRLHIPDEQNEVLSDLSEINMGTTLFELYLVLKRFPTLGIYIFFVRVHRIDLIALKFHRNCMQSSYIQCVDNSWPSAVMQEDNLAPVKLYFWSFLQQFIVQFVQLMAINIGIVSM